MTTLLASSRLAKGLIGTHGFVKNFHKALATTGVRTKSIDGTENMSNERIEEITKRVKSQGGSPSWAKHIIINHSSSLPNDLMTIKPIPYSSPKPPINQEQKQLSMAEAIDSDTKMPPKLEKKITIVGCGQVGLATAFSILNQGTADTLVIIDIDPIRLEGEVKDLRQGSAFFGSHIRVVGSTDYAETVDSDLVIISAGAAQQPGESRLSLMDRNVSVMKSIVPRVLKYSPDTAICVVSNPCDIMTAIAAKIAGEEALGVSPGRIFGSGTVLDSSRLQTLIGSTINVDSRDVRGYVVGEHGDSSVPIFTSVKVGGVSLLQPGEEPSEEHVGVHSEVVRSAGDVIEKKGYTNWAVGMACSHISKVVVNDERRMLTVSTCIRGLYDDMIDEDVFLSVPCIVGANGIERIIRLPMSQWERDRFRQSAQKVWDVQKDIWDRI